MRHVGSGAVIESDEAKIKKCGEYYTLAKKLNNLFITITQLPHLLIIYLDTDRRTLMEEAAKLLPISPITPYLLPWAQLFCTNQIPLDKIYLLFYAIICKIAIPRLNNEEKTLLCKLQRNAAERNLTLEKYGSRCLQTGFIKLADFFASEYSKFYGMSKV